jgi:hypothetical protein
MITFEESLGKLVQLLPDVTIGENDYSIKYNWGTQEVLNKYLITNKENSYPLVWLIVGRDSNDIYKKNISRNARIVIATRSMNKEEFNEFQFQTYYKEILYPIQMNLIKVLRRSGISAIIDDVYNSEFVPNYSFNDEAGTLVDVWNAIVLNMEISFVTDYQCRIKQVKFDTKSTDNGGGDNGGGDNGGGDNGGGDNGGGGGCLIPVITSQFNYNQFTNNIFVTAGKLNTFQITAINNPTSYDVTVPFVNGQLEGLVVNNQTGLVEFTPSLQIPTNTYIFNFKAINNCGVGQYGRFIKVVSEDVSILNPPYNPTFSDVNAAPTSPTNKNFMYSVEFLPYMNGIITSYEVWVKGPYTNEVYALSKNFFGPLLNNALGLLAMRIEWLTPGTYLVKSRIKNSNNEYSEFSEEITVILP